MFWRLFKRNKGKDDGVKIDDPILLRVFQWQVTFQLRAVSLAAKDVDIAIARLNGGDNSAMPGLWFAIQNMLGAAGNVSKACWGQAGKYAKHRKLLRDSIGIKNDSPLRATGMRNNFEHYDERLDEWWTKSKDHNHADMNVGSIAGLDPTDNFRALDPQTMEVLFWGKRYDLKEIVAEAERLLPAAEVEASKPPWVS